MVGHNGGLRLSAVSPDAPDTYPPSPACRNPGAQAMTSFADLDIYPRWRIGAYMHAVYLRVGRDRHALKMAAEDCAGWYDVSLQTVIRVWHAAYPRDLDIMEGICQTN